MADRGEPVETETSQDRDLRQAMEGTRQALAAARQAGDAHAEASLLVDLSLTAEQHHAYDAMRSYVAEAWAVAEEHRFFDQLARLCRLFGDFALAQRDYSRLSDHYANACAYALAHDVEEFWRVVARIDQVVGELAKGGQFRPAISLCEMLLAYEGQGGLGREMPEFRRHFAAQRERLKRALVAASRSENSKLG